MDNRVDLPGYKYYVDPTTGERPPIYVAFVDLAEDSAATVEGVVFRASDERFAQLDARERNYGRHDVTAQIHPPPGGTTYAYIGTPEGRARFEAGSRARAVYVARGYLEAVTTASSEPPPLPIRDLERVDLGPT